MNITKSLAQRVFGKVKQDSRIPYQFHINVIQGGKKRTRTEILEQLYDDLKSWCNRYGVVIEISNSNLKAFGSISVIVRDYRAVTLLEEACKGYYKGKLL